MPAKISYWRFTKMRKRFFISIGFVCLMSLLSTSCSPKIVESVRTEYEVRDSIIVQIHEKIIKDTVTLEIPQIIEKVVVPQSEPSHLENAYAQSDAFIDSLGFLHHSLETKHQEIAKEVEVSVADTNTFHWNKERYSSVKKVTIEKSLTLWQRVRLFGFYVLLAALPIAANWKTLWPIIRKLLQIIKKFI